MQLWALNLKYMFSFKTFWIMYFLICFCMSRIQVLMVRIEQFVIEVILCSDPSFSIEIGDEVHQVVCFLQLQT